MCGALLYGLTFLGFLFGTTVWLLLHLRLAQGAAYALVTTASTAVVVDISPLELRRRSLSYFLLSVSIATTIGPALGIFFINRFSFRVFFILLSTLCLCCFITILGSRVLRIAAHMGNGQYFFPAPGRRKRHD